MSQKEERKRRREINEKEKRKKSFLRLRLVAAGPHLQAIAVSRGTAGGTADLEGYVFISIWLALFC